VQNLPVVPTRLIVFAPTRILAVPDILACLLGAGEMSASDLFVSITSRLCDWPSREAAANVIARLRAATTVSAVDGRHAFGKRAAIRRGFGGSAWSAPA
jgi:hypothetical protein